MGICVGMWSGPRNISTAMMRSWEARRDTLVCDEPLYAAYLARTGLDHPGAEEIIEHDETDFGRVVDRLVEPPKPPVEIFYQKHMAHHLLDGDPTDWVSSLRNAFLIREPSAMLSSLLKVIPNPDEAATGLPRQVELFCAEADRLGSAPPVIDSRAVLENPGGMLRALCAGLGVAYTPAMLAWEPGPRATDGVWAKHWYASVERSTGFDRPSEKPISIPARFTPVLRACEALYEQLAEHALAPMDGDEGGADAANL